jgi:hypothetical protein
MRAASDRVRADERYVRVLESGLDRLEAVFFGEIFWSRAARRAVAGGGLRPLDQNIAPKTMLAAIQGAK